MELRDYFTALRRRWPILMVTTILLTSFGLALGLASPREYAARTELFVRAQSGGSAQELVNANAYVQSRVQSYVRLVRSDVVLSQVVDELSWDTTVGALSNQVSAEAPADTVLLNVTAVDSDPERAAEIANAVADVLQEVVDEMEPSRTAEGAPVIGITVVDRATPPSAPSSTRLEMLVLLGAVSGAALGFTLAIATHVLDMRLRRPEDLAELTDAPVLGYVPSISVPKKPRLVGVSRHDTWAASLRGIRSNLQFIRKQDHLAYVLTASQRNEGTTTLVVNLALAYAETGASVCVVDSDMRRPRISDLLGWQDQPGLSEILIGRAEPDDLLQRWDSQSGAIDVITAGHIPPNPLELLSGTAMAQLVEDLHKRYDVLLLDSPPLNHCSDAAILARLCEGAIVVASLGRHAVTAPRLGNALHTLQSANAPVAGTILTKLPRRVFRKHAAQYVASSASPAPSPEKKQRSRRVAS